MSSLLTSTNTSLYLHDRDGSLRCPYSNKYLTEAVTLSCGHVVAAEVAKVRFGLMIGNLATKPNKCMICSNRVVSYQPCIQFSNLVQMILELKAAVTDVDSSYDSKESDSPKASPTNLSPAHAEPEPAAPPTASVSELGDDDIHSQYMESVRKTSSGMDPDIIQSKAIRDERLAEKAKKDAIAKMRAEAKEEDDEDSRLIFHME